MIRDPSDGSVKEIPQPEIPIPEMPVDPLIVAINTALIAGKVRPERVSAEWQYQRAWNDGIDFALMQVKRIAERAEK